ncbi:MAG: hypothetical protein R6V12_15645, partial [Candidatus Hydrogenedentota bacterium]
MVAEYYWDTFEDGCERERIDVPIGDLRPQYESYRAMIFDASTWPLYKEHECARVIRCEQCGAVSRKETGENKSRKAALWRRKILPRCYMLNADIFEVHINP